MQTLTPHITRMAEKLGILSSNPEDIQNTSTFRRNVQGLLGFTQQTQKHITTMPKIHSINRYWPHVSPDW